MSETKTYIVEIPQLLGDDTTIYLEADGDAVKSLFAVLAVSADGASIVDNGYRSIEEAYQSWPEAIRPTPYRLTPNAIEQNCTIRGEGPNQKLT